MSCYRAEVRQEEAHLQGRELELVRGPAQRLQYLVWHRGGCNKRGCAPGQLLFWTLENHPSVEGLCAPSMRITSWICEFNACANIL